MEKEFKQFEYAEKKGDAVLVFSETSEEEAEKRLDAIIRIPSEWDLVDIV